MPLDRTHQIAVKLETAEGTDPWGGGQPAAGDVLNAFDPDVQDSTDFLERDSAGSSLSRGFDAITRSQRAFTFRIDFVGNTTGGTDDDKRNAIPPWDALLRSAGFGRVNVIRVTGSVSGGPFYVAERVGDATWVSEPTNWGIALTDGTGQLMVVDIKGTLAAAGAFHGEQSGASIATPTIDATGGRAYVPESRREITADLTVAGWSPSDPSAGDVVLVKRAGEQVGAGIILTVADPITLSVYYGSVLESDVLETADGKTATVEAASAITVLKGGSCALYSNLEPKARKSLGARGDWTLGGDSGSVLEWNWTFRGTAPDPYDEVAIAGVTLDPLQGPRFIGATIGLGYDRTGAGAWFNDQDLPIKSVQVAPGSTLEDRRSAHAATGILGAFLTDRDPVVTLEIEEGSVLAFGWDALKNNGTPVRFGFTFGSVVGNQLAVVVPNGQVVEVGGTEADGLSANTVQIKARRVREAGNDELIIAKF